MAERKGPETPVTGMRCRAGAHKVRPYESTLHEHEYEPDYEQEHTNDPRRSRVPEYETVGCPFLPVS